jgi:aspartate racemase
MMTTQPKVAVIGGMGPLASAEFVTTIYERAAGTPEQQMPSLLLWSDPTFPDRTTALLDGRPEVLVEPLQESIERCGALGASMVVICCVTVHAVLPSLPAHLRSRVVSLVDVLLTTAMEQQRRLLLLASIGSRRTRVFEDHPLWARASHWLVWPDGDDQRRVHQAIYDIKQNTRLIEAKSLVERLRMRYGADSFAAGCTEFHVLHRRWGAPGLDCVDPLDIIATRLAASPARIATATGTR